MNHPPVPVQQFPGLPRNIIERHEVNRVWRAHHPQPSQPPQPFVPVPPLLPPFQPYPQAPPQPMEEIRRGDIFYEGVAHPSHNHNQHVPMQPLAYPQGSHQPMGGLRPRVDYGAALMAGFQQDHETRRRNRHRPRNQHNAATSIPTTASRPEPGVDQFNAQFHQHIIDFQRAAEEQQQRQMEQEQAEHQHRQNELLARQQAHEAHLHFQAEQARLRLEAEQTRLRFEAEQHYQNQVAQQERLTQQRREYEQQQHLEEMYEEHSQLSQEAA
ncbi:hypothetical protein BU15DRAFT_67493 [Melanogaster broomeanus]|nr:hypothetical protein BU15DRAFT_67493 [Melanogaster broomeanus]